MNLNSESFDLKRLPLSPVERELAFQRYVNALEVGNDDELQIILELALSDAVLCERLGAANEALAEEITPQLVPEIAPHAQIVEDLARQHIPMGFEKPQPRTLTFGDVAQELAKRREIPASDLQISTQLSADKTPLPAPISLPEIRKIGRTLGQKVGLASAISDRFWREFHGAAVSLAKRHSNRERGASGWGGMAAGLAREENTRRPPRRPQPKEENDSTD